MAIKEDVLVSPSVGTPVPMLLYQPLALTLLLAGLGATGAFFLYEVSKTRYSKSLVQELFLAVVASVLLGLGTLFLLLWTGVYV